MSGDTAKATEVAILEIQVIRADGTVEDLGVVACTHADAMPDCGACVRKQIEE